MDSLVQHFVAYFAHYGYWTIAAALLLENAGIPVPGETVLIVASALAHNDGGLRLPEIIAVASLAAALGDNLGYGLGRWGGRRLLARYGQFFHLGRGPMQRAESVFRRYGSLTVFFARFVAGLRVVAGPLAGVLRMRWGRFVLFNALGAMTWVTVVASLGYLFGRQLPVLARTMGVASLVLLGTAVFLLLVFRKRLMKA